MRILDAEQMGEHLTKELVYYISHYGNPMTDRFDLYHIDADKKHFRAVVEINPGSWHWMTGDNNTVKNEFIIPVRRTKELEGLIQDMQAWIVMVSWSREGTSKKKEVAA